MLKNNSLSTPSRLSTQVDLRPSYYSTPTVEMLEDDEETKESAEPAIPK